MTNILDNLTEDESYSPDWRAIRGDCRRYPGGGGGGAVADVTLHCGDCALVMADFEPDSIDLTVTSPPYDNLRTYNGYVFDFEAIAAQLWRVTKPGGVVVWVVGDATINGSETGTSFRQALHFMGLGFNLHDTMIYKIKGTGAKGSNKAYWQAWEFMLVFSKGEIKTFNALCDKKNITKGGTSRGRNTKQDGTSGTITNVVTQEFGRRDNVWEYQPGNDDSTDHPAPFPEALARDHILSWSNPGDTILDPFMGSGTTGKMAVRYDRHFIGIDISTDYIELARKRIAKEAAQMKLEI